MEYGSIEREIHIDASPEVVFDVVRLPEHLRAWWPDEAEVDPVPGAAGRDRRVATRRRYLVQSRWSTPTRRDCSRSAGRTERARTGAPGNSPRALRTRAGRDGGTVLRLTETGCRDRGWDEAKVASGGYAEHVSRMGLLPRAAATKRSKVERRTRDRGWSTTTCGRRSAIRPGDGCSTCCCSTAGGTATSLSEHLPVTRQAVTKHLGVLERVGLVHGHRGRAGEALPGGRASSPERWPNSRRSAPPGTADSSASSGSPRRSRQSQAPDNKGNDMTDILHRIGRHRFAGGGRTTHSRRSTGWPTGGPRTRRATPRRRRDRLPLRPHRRVRHEGARPRPGRIGGKWSKAPRSGSAPPSAGNSRRRPSGRSCCSSTRAGGAGRVHVPLQHEVGDVLDEPQATRRNRRRRPPPTRCDDQRLALKLSRLATLHPRRCMTVHSPSGERIRCRQLPCSGSGTGRAR